MKRPKRGDLVYVELPDIEHENSGWQDMSVVSKAKVKEFHAVGWVLRATKKTLTITPMTGVGRTFCAYHLPRASIHRIVRLRWPK